MLRCLIIFCLLIFGQNNLFGQQDNVGNAELQSLLEKLQNRTEQLKSELGTPAVQSPGAGSLPTGLPAEGQSVVPQTPDPDVQSTYKAIQERIKLLKLIKDRQAASEDLEQLPKTPGKMPTPKLPEAAMLQLDSPPPSTIASVAPQPEAQAPIAATRIMPNPVNTLEMANSIFLTRNYSAALEAYNKVDEKKIPSEDAMWLHTMKAACQRKLDQEAAATGYYREITNVKSGSLPVKKNATFWLKYIEAKGRNRQLYESIDQDLSLLLERANERIGQPK